MKLTTSILAFLFLLVGSCWSPITAQEQDWRLMIQDPSANFYDIQDAYEREMGGIPYTKGLGMKQYKRWEYYWESRVDEQGNFPEPGHILQEMQAYYAHQGQQKSYLTGSGNWSLLGPIALPNNGTGQLNGNGRLNCIAFHPTNSSIIYVGAPSGGFWKSTDGGSSWSKQVTGMTRLGVSSIVVHPTNPNTIYIGTGDRDGGDVAGYGVWRSTDGGLTWAAYNSGMGNRTVNELIMDPNNSSILYAACSNSRIYKSTNGGASWTSSSIGTNPKDIAMHPSNSSILYAGGTRFYRSTDAGASWSLVTSGLPSSSQRIALAVSANQPDWVYILAGQSSGLQGIYRSTNKGVSFSTRATSPNILGYDINGNDNSSQAWYDLVLAADPTNANTIYTGGVNLWKSTDGGSTMTSISYWVGPSSGRDGVHADQHALEFSPHNNALYNGNDGGLYVTANGGTTWDDLSSGLAIAQVYKIGVSQQTADKAINGYQDNGTAISQGTLFQTEIGGDGMECIIDPTTDQYLYGALYYGDIRRSTNSGSSFSSIANSISETGAWVTPYTLDPNNANRMFAGFDNIWRNDAVRTGTSWTKISSFSNTSNIRDIAVAPSNSNVVYLSKYDNSFRISTNALAASPTWTNRAANLPVNNEPLDIAVDPNNWQHVYIALNNNIYESFNAGQSWTDISGTLPNISLNTIVIDENSTVGAMYVGMDVGVYYKDNTLSDWVPYFTALPNIEVTELEIHYGANACEGLLYAATYGQGLWKSDLKAPNSVAPIACFEVDNNSVCSGVQVQLKDNSAYNPSSWSWSISPSTYYYTGGTNASSQHPKVVFTAAGSYSISLTVSNSSGSNSVSKNNYMAVSTATSVANAKEDFESQNTCSTSANCGSTSCSLSGAWSNVPNNAGDDIDWRVDVGGTPSSSTGPSVDYSQGTSTGKYAYIEGSGCYGKEAQLVSSCIQLNGNYYFKLHYHAYGSNIGSLHVDVFANGSWILDAVPAIVGDQGNSWKPLSVNLSPYNGQSIKLRLRAYTGSSYRTDIAIDDLQLTTNPSTAPNTNFGIATTVRATCTGKGYNQLSWDLLDKGIDGVYQIQKYQNQQWQTIEEVAAEKGQQHYEWKDQQPFLGENLYRIVLPSENKNGLADISEVAKTDCKVDLGSFVVYPNPFRGEVQLQLEAPMAAELPYLITNTLGQVLIKGNFQTQEGVNNFVLPMQSLPQGVYLLHTQDRIVKLVKN